MKRLALALGLVLLTSCGGANTGEQSGASWVGNWLLLLSDGRRSSTNDTTLNLTTSGFSIHLGGEFTSNDIPCTFGGSWYGNSSNFTWYVANGSCQNVAIGSIVTGGYSVSADGQNLSINFTSPFIASAWIAQLISQ